MANVPQVVYRYPVYKTDIEHFGFHIIDLGDELSWDDNNLAQVSLQRIGAAAEQTEAYLFDTALRQQHMQENYAIGQKHLSYKALSEILATVF